MSEANRAERHTADPARPHPRRQRVNRIPLNRAVCVVTVADDRIADDVFDARLGAPDVGAEFVRGLLPDAVVAVAVAADFVPLGRNPPHQKNHSPNAD